MARIVLGSYMVRYPLGGMLSWVLQYLVGFTRLGHEVYFVEDAGYPQACFDPLTKEMTDDCSYGIKVLDELLARFDLQDQWCFVDIHGAHHGMTEKATDQILSSADAFIDMGTHGNWLERAAGAGRRVLIDGEPGLTQLKNEIRSRRGETTPRYDRYFTTGQNIGTPAATAPRNGVTWEHIFHPVVTDLFNVAPPPERAALTTIMNWSRGEGVAFEGKIYGHKDVEFSRFMTLPKAVSASLEVAVSGSDAPIDELRSNGWIVRDGHEVTFTFESFRSYLANSLAEFGVCKNGYVATNSGWFSDRSAAYLASGRAVILQDTGFSSHLPCGEGLFAVADVEDAAAAIDTVLTDPARHGRAAVDLAHEYLDASRVLRGLLDELDV